MKICSSTSSYIIQLQKQILIQVIKNVAVHQATQYRYKAILQKNFKLFPKIPGLGILRRI